MTVPVQHSDGSQLDARHWYHSHAQCGSFDELTEIIEAAARDATTRVALWDKLLSMLYLQRAKAVSTQLHDIVAWLVEDGNPAASTLPGSYFAALKRFLTGAFPLAAKPLLAGDDMMVRWWWSAVVVVVVVV